MTTYYEVVARHPDGRKLLVGYTARRSRHGVLAMLRTFPGLAALTDEDTVHLGLAPKPWLGYTLGAWAVVFSGRTERDAKQEGELERVG